MFNHTDVTYADSGFIDPDIGEYEDAFFGYMGSVVAGTFINFVYIILINLVLQAIISGLIIDTFGEMRQQNEDIEQDIYDKCFICDISRLLHSFEYISYDNFFVNIFRDEFEQAEIPFKEHVTSEHNMWHYLWFMLYLDSIDPLSFTGPEYYASQFIVDKNVLNSLHYIFCVLMIYFIEFRSIGTDQEKFIY